MNTNVKSRTMEFIRYKGLAVKSFEQRCGLSNGYVAAMRQGFGADKLKNVLSEFPDLNRDWLLYGEGTMLKEPISQKASGGHNTQIAGNGNNVNNASTIDKALDEIAEQRKLVSKSQEQIDRLLSIIEHFQKIGITN